MQLKAKSQSDEWLQSSKLAGRAGLDRQCNKPCKQLAQECHTDGTHNVRADAWVYQEAGRTEAASQACS